MSTLTEIARLLRGARRVLALSHIAPDGDAIGSLLGFGWVLAAAWRNAGADADHVFVPVCADPVPAQFGWLPGSGNILSAAPPGPWDVVVGLDASDAPRLGPAFRPADYGAAPIVILDHHVTNLQFGALNYVDTTAVATAQIVVDLAAALAAPIGPEAATCLLTGLVTDTLGFRTANVTPAVLAVAMRLMEAGASLSEVTGRTLNYRPFSLLRLWGLALADVRLERGVVWAVITREMRQRVAAPDSGDGGLVSQLINAPEATIAAVFAETSEGLVEIGFRAKPGYDVSQVALSLGGGGHPQAAGCTIAGPLADAQRRVLPLLFRLT
ncbi:MAG: DHH family phosphoesterase, partial [Anaerolineae bacterium]